MYTSRHASQAGNSIPVARTAYVGLPLFCLLQTSCCTHLWAFEAPFLSWLKSSAVKGLPRVKEPFLFHSLLPGVQDPSRFPFFFFLSFVLHKSYVVIFLAILVIWDSPVFSRYSVRIVICVGVFLMCLSGEMSPPILLFHHLDWSLLLSLMWF